MGMEDGLDAVVERQARQMRTIGIVLIIAGLVAAAGALHDALTGEGVAGPRTATYGIVGAAGCLSGGIGAIARSRTVLRELAQKRAERERNR